LLELLKERSLADKIIIREFEVLNAVSWPPVYGGLNGGAIYNRLKIRIKMFWHGLSDIPQYF
jgi:hypothetical protein